MKKLTLFLLLLPLLSASQTPAKISVHFAISAADSCNITKQKYYINEYEPVYKTAIFDNACNISVPVEKPSMVKFNYNNQWVWLYLEPGVEINLNVGLDTLYKSVTFSGKTAAENIFLRDFFIEFHKDLDKDAVKQSILSSGIDAFENNLYNAHKKQLAYYDNHPDKARFSEMFRSFIENTIRYTYFSSLLSYPIINANQSEKILKVNALPDVMLEGIDQKLCKDEALSNDVYRDFLNYYIIYFTSKANGFNKFKDYNISMESKIQTAQQQLPPVSLIWYIADFLNTDCNKVAPYTAKHIYEMLKEKEGVSGVYSELLKKKCEAHIRTKEVVEKTKEEKSGTSENVSKTNSDYPLLKDMNGKSFGMDDFKGKVVYIDFWASWCGPCRAEMPASKQLHEMFTDKQLKSLVFLYISIDPTEEAWKNAVQQIGMEGKLGISPGNWNSEIVKYFQINIIPRYMLMDKKGRIVELNANRPSSGQLIYNDILKLLEE
jgi:thiol-disulfide isomerase/thioredoxin